MRGMGNISEERKQKAVNVIANEVGNPLF